MQRSGKTGRGYGYRILTASAITLLLLTLAALCPAGARWTAGGVEVRGNGLTGDAYSPRIIPDGSGGAIMTWTDKRNGQSDIYAQRVLVNGTVDPSWPANGREVRGSGLTGDADSPQIVTDGSGGAIITWQDNRTGIPDIYAQRVLASGTVDPAWPANGLAVCTDPDYQNSPQLASDGLGGAVITWPDRRSTTNYNIYAQRVLAGGAVDPAWPANGLAVCTALPNGQGSPRIILDGSGGAIIAFTDGHSMLGDDVYAQRVLLGGTVDPAWPVNGRAVCTAANGQFTPRIITDGSGGAIISWEDHRSGPNPDVYAQRVLLGGTVDPAWPANGRAVCDTADEQFGPRLASDGSAGAIVTWRDDRSGNYDVYAQRLLAGGTKDPAWPADGRAVCGATSNQYAPEIASDGSGGAIIVWEDERPAPNYDIYTQRVLPDGTLCPDWPASGLEVCNAVDDQYSTDIASDGSGDAVIAWEDRRSGSRYDIYAQRVTAGSSTWYLAEGATAGDFETWVLVQNPGASAVTVDLTLMTEYGRVNPPLLQGVPVPANSRISFNLGEYVQTYNVSTRVDASGTVICERAMYGGARTWGTDSIGATAPASTWYLAEGATAGDFETWVLVQNPGASPVSADLTFMTSAGPQAGPQDVPIAAYSRTTFNVGGFVSDYNVSTRVESAGGGVVCERAMYGGARTWAHDSVGVTQPASTWYLAEGCTAGGFETWVLVQNPNAADVTVDLTLMTDTGSQSPPALQGVLIGANSRQSFDLGLYSVNYDVSTVVQSTGGEIICERAVYGGARTWGTDSIGATSPAYTWYLAEGCTGGDFETFVLVQNPNAAPVSVDLTLMTSSGEQKPPALQGVTIPAYSRSSFKLNHYVTDYNVSTRVTSLGGRVVAERAMYGNGRTWAHDSVGYAQ